MEVLLDLARKEVAVHQIAQTFQRRGGAGGDPSAAVINLAKVGAQAERYGVKRGPDG